MWCSYNDRKRNELIWTTKFKAKVKILFENHFILCQKFTYYWIDLNYQLNFTYGIIFVEITKPFIMTCLLISLLIISIYQPVLILTLSIMVRVEWTNTWVVELVYYSNVEILHKIWTHLKWPTISMGGKYAPEL